MRSFMGSPAWKRRFNSIYDTFEDEVPLASFSPPVLDHGILETLKGLTYFMHHESDLEHYMGRALSNLRSFSLLA